MIVVPAPANVNGDGLVAELITAGVPVADKGVILNGTDIEVILTPDNDNNDDTHLAKVTQVVAAHTGSPSPEAVFINNRRTDARDGLQALLAVLGGPNAVRTKLRAVAAGTDTLTPAQSQRLLAILALVVLRDNLDVR